jgi:hypothetical protein
LILREDEYKKAQRLKNIKSSNKDANNSTFYKHKHAAINHELTKAEWLNVNVNNCSRDGEDYCIAKIAVADLSHTG